MLLQKLGIVSTVQEQSALKRLLQDPVVAKALQEKILRDELDKEVIRPGDLLL